ncbi:MAG: hypothetical protein ACJ8BW_11890 [Ktedonobacteraceae bacterium]
MYSFVGKSDEKEAIRDQIQLVTSHYWPFAQLDRTTIRFLETRRDPNHRVLYGAVQDITGHQWNFTSLLSQKDGLWYVRTFDCGPDGGEPERVLNEPAELRDCPWIRLGQLISNDFYAFGEVFDKGYQIERVRLLEQGKLVLEDTVQDGIVLFYSNQLPTIPPIQLELYNTSGIIVSRQTQTRGSFPTVTKEV